MEIETIDPNFPQYISFDVDYEYKQIRGAAYIQDKIDYEGLVANIGLRYDFMDPKASRPALEESIVGDRSEWIINHDQTVPASVKHQLSPRLGVALPIGPGQELHINYGYFFQMPLFDYFRHESIHLYPDWFKVSHFSVQPGNEFTIKNVGLWMICSDNGF